MIQFLKQLCLAFCFLTSMSALADTYVTIGDLRYQLYGTEAFVSGYVGSPTDVAIPATIESDGLTFRVTQILHSAFNSCNTLTSVKAEKNNLKVIGPYAFYGATALQKADFQAVTDVEHHAFENCTALEEMVLPKVQVINYEAFNLCKNLSKIDLGNDLRCLSQKSFWNCTKLSVVIIPKSCIYYYTSVH